ncbi:putative bifunctional diguanylate cyclase/phosphodiesterase [Chthonobacter albigriseus]|uniref:putative bifunctional diguanylate cyclase/phosphodiesterase n=1 Tax=Chthonobacter albigriseus TaxID=1683161 RepID=UPI0015EF63B3|nr:bifunctional diguanylate cyclase/phosphodiesterase [Chthonobacter albigriseus]
MSRHHAASPERGNPAPQGSTPVASPNIVGRTVSVLVGATALIVAAILPWAYYSAAEWRLRGEIEAELKLHAQEAGIAVGQNPDLWNALAGTEPVTRLIHLPNQVRGDAKNQTGFRLRILRPDGTPVVDEPSVQPLLWPVITAKAGFLRDLGVMEISGTLRPVLLETLKVALGSAFLALLLFYLVRELPIRLLNRAMARANFLARHDVLTGLGNRALFIEQLEIVLGSQRTSQRPAAVFFVDIDHFKAVNDTHGHTAGDCLLRAFADRLKGAVRAGDTVARLGGDEFAVISTQLGDPGEAMPIAQRLLAITATETDPPLPYAERLGISIGVCVIKADSGLTPAAILKNADVALYQAKATGRGRACLFSAELDGQIRARRSLEEDLQTAVREGQFKLAFQPQVDLRTRRIIGAEALLRWDRPGHGSVSPAEFVPVAESTGIICDIDRWALEEACRVAAQLPGDISIAVNVSPMQFRRDDFVPGVIAALYRSGLPAHRLELEITEGMMLKDGPETFATLDLLNEMGVRVAVDDFGVGYSSLGYLSRFEFDRIKIDRMFVMKVDSDPSALAVVKAVIGLSQALGFKLIAEGIETHAQAATLIRLGCVEGQGFLYGRPMPAADLADLLASPFSRAVSV